MPYAAVEAACLIESAEIAISFMSPMYMNRTKEVYPMMSNPPLTLLARNWHMLIAHIISLTAAVEASLCVS